MQRWRIILLASFLALPASSEPAEIMYYHFLGDYLDESPYRVDFNVRNTSIQEIYSSLGKIRQKETPMSADLVLIGYGSDSSPKNFFAASSALTSSIPLKKALETLPMSTPNGRWFIIFVDKSLSPYVLAKKEHHWASPFLWLSRIGLIDLHYCTLP